MRRRTIEKTRRTRHGKSCREAGGAWRSTTPRCARRASRQAGEARQRHASGEGEGRHASWWREGAESAQTAGLVLRQHGVVVGLALGGVGGGDGVDDGLGLLVADLLVVVDDVAQVVATRVVRLAHAHRVVREVDIAVVAEDCVAWGVSLALAE